MLVDGQGFGCIEILLAKFIREGRSMGDIKRIKWIDGLKGLACIGIFYHHFLLRYVPESYYGSKWGYCSTLNLYLSGSPLGVLINGNFFVFIFILLSGFVVCKRIINISPTEVGLFMIRRYLKLAIPIFICETFYYVFYRLGIGGQLFTEEDKINSFFMVVENSFVRVLCEGDTTFAGAFWMMNVIFVGGILVIAIATIGWKNKKYAMYVFGITSFAMLTQRSYYFSVLFAGAGLYCFFELVQISSCMVTEITGVFIALLLGGYPTGIVPQNGIYGYMFLPFTDNSAYLYHWFASIILFISIYRGTCIKRVLEVNIIQRLGGISYIFFVFHNFVRKILDPLYNLVLKYWDSRTMAVIIDSSIALIILLGICKLYKCTFYHVAIRVEKCLLKPLLQKGDDDSIKYKEIKQ